MNKKQLRKQRETDKRAEARAARLTALSEQAAEDPEAEAKVRVMFYQSLSRLINLNAGMVGIEKTIDWMDEAVVEWKKLVAAEKLKSLVGTDKEQ